MTLIEQREALLREYETFLDTCKPFNAERNSEFQARIAKIDLKISEQRNREVVDTTHRAAPGATFTGTTIQGQVRGVAPEVQEKELRAFDLFLRRGANAVSADAELRTYSPLDSTTGANGGFLVPTIMGPQIEAKQKSAGAILTVVKDLPTDNGDPINWPTSDDTSQNGEFIAENAAVGQANPVFGNVQIGAFQWDSKQVLVPLSLLQDSKFDVVAHLADCFGGRAGRAFSNRLVADGTDGVLANVGSTSTAASATLLNYFEPLTIQGNVDLAYNNENSCYAMSFKTYLGYRALVSATTNIPLWPEAEARAGLLHGRKYVICNDVPDFGTTTNKYLVYGDFSKIIFRRVGQMNVFRFNELFMSNLQQGFQAFQRVAGKVIQPAALTILKAA